MFGISNYPNWRSGMKSAAVLTLVLFFYLVASDLWDLCRLTGRTELEMTRELVWKTIGSDLGMLIPCFVVFTIPLAFRPKFMK